VHSVNMPLRAPRGGRSVSAACPRSPWRHRALPASVYRNRHLSERNRRRFLCRRSRPLCGVKRPRSRAPCYWLSWLRDGEACAGSANPRETFTSASDQFFRRMVTAPAPRIRAAAARQYAPTDLLPRSGITWTLQAQPFQTTGREAERLLRLLVRGAAQLRAVVDSVLAGRRPRLLLGNPGRRRGMDESGECRQPDGDGRRVVIDDVVHAGRCREDVCSGDRRVLDLDPRPDAPVR